MCALETFIQSEFRPNIEGARLDQDHQTYFFIKPKKSPKSSINAICFGPKQDKVLVNLEQTILNQDNILVLYYEDIHKRWSYVQTHQENYFIYQKNHAELLMIKPKCLYIRGCYVKENHPMWRVLGDFYCFVNHWPGKVLCAPKAQCSNESKLYQLNHSLRQAAKNITDVSIGKSYVIKGTKRDFKKIASKSYIVKSLSGIRSIVVDESTYSHWDEQNIQHLPVLFQEKVEGQDLRVHVLENKLFAQLACSKSTVDYRYDKAFFNLKSVEKLSKNLSQFALSTGKLEKNQLIGIDFIKTPAHHVVLEANPSPGWSAYHECHGIQIPAFIKALICLLK